MIFLESDDFQRRAIKLPQNTVKLRKNFRSRSNGFTASRKRIMAIQWFNEVCLQKRACFHLTCAHFPTSFALIGGSPSWFLSGAMWERFPLRKGHPRWSLVFVWLLRGKAARCLSQLHNPFFPFFQGAPNLEEWCFLSTVDAFFHPLRLVVYPTVGTIVVHPKVV